MRPLLAAAIALAAACSEPVVATRASDIRGGSTDPGDPAVAALSTGGVSYCTGTLVAPHTLLTAGHCANVNASVDFGPTETGATQRVAVKMVTRHPQYTGEGKPYDFALFELASNPVGIAPMALDGTPMSASDVGREIRHVGFGVTDDSTGVGRGVKRTVTYPITRVDGMLVYSGAPGEQTCSGDSGGPGLLPASGGGEVIACLVSDGPACQLSEDGWDDRVDLVKDWIVQVATGWGDLAPEFGDGGLPAAADAGTDAAAGAPDASVDAEREDHGGCAAAGEPSLSPIVLLLVGLANLHVRRKRRPRRVSV